MNHLFIIKNDALTSHTLKQFTWAGSRAHKTKQKPLPQELEFSQSARQESNLVLLKGEKNPGSIWEKVCCVLWDRDLADFCVCWHMWHTNGEQPPQLLHVAPGYTDNFLYSETGNTEAQGAYQPAADTMATLAVDFYLTQHLGIYYWIYYYTLRKHFSAPLLSAWFPQIHENIYPWIHFVCRSVKQLFTFNSALIKS